MNDQAVLALAKAKFGIDTGAVRFTTPDIKRDYRLAMDAQPNLVTTTNGGIPAFLTTFMDPDLLRILQAPTKAAEIFPEEKRGDWLTDTAVFPIVEQTGEVSAYGDYSNSGMSGANTDFPQRQVFNFQTNVKWGDRELERAGLAKIGWAAEQKNSAVNTLQRFGNTVYFFGVAGLQNYGILNDPSLSAPFAPSVKAAGGVSWFVNGVPNATANEVYNDIVALVTKVIVASQGNVDATNKFTLALSPQSGMALQFTNLYNVNVQDLIKKNFPGMRIVIAPQYGASSSSNTQGSAAGEIVQVIADDVLGQKTGLVAFNEKLRAFPVIVHDSWWTQKMGQGSWGFINRQPFAIAQMIGV